MFFFYLLQESISTCRFSQRVALISNDAILNEIFDPDLVKSFILSHKLLFLPFSGSFSPHNYVGVMIRL